MATGTHTHSTHTHTHLGKLEHTWAKPFFGQTSVRLQRISTKLGGIFSPRCGRESGVGPGPGGGQKLNFYPPPPPGARGRPGAGPGPGAGEIRTWAPHPPNSKIQFLAPPGPGPTPDSRPHRGEKIPPSFIEIRCNRTDFWPKNGLAQKMFAPIWAPGGPPGGSGGAGAVP